MRGRTKLDVGREVVGDGLELDPIDRRVGLAALAEPAGHPAADVLAAAAARAWSDAPISRRLMVTVTSDGAGDGDWGVEEALDDVGGVLSTAAGVALVSLAVLVPLALVLALIGLAYRLTVRRGRERALDAPGDYSS
jgi:hypothetical protein